MNETIQNTVKTIQNTINTGNTYYQNTHTYTHITKPTHTHTHYKSHTYTNPRITKQVKTTTVQDTNQTSHNTIKYPQYKITLMCIVLLFYLSYL